MSRPDFITDEDILRWQKEIDSHETIKRTFSTPQLVEIYYASSYLAEELEKMNCPQSWVFRIIYSASKASFGKDPWEIHMEFLENYKNDTLDFEVDTNNLN